MTDPKHVTDEVREVHAALQSLSPEEQHAFFERNAARIERWRRSRKRQAVPHASRRLSRLDKDPEVKAFVIERLGTVDQSDIRAQIVASYGSERAPSKTALNRFAVRFFKLA